MIDCTNCPCLSGYWSENLRWIGMCGISGEIVGDGIKEDDCDLKRIELKDGTVFEPKGEENE